MAHIGILKKGEDTLQFKSDPQLWGSEVIVALSVPFEPVPYLKQYHDQHPEVVMSDINVDDLIEEMEEEMDMAGEEEEVGEEDALDDTDQETVQEADDGVEEKEPETEEASALAPLPIIEENVQTSVDNTQVIKEIHEVDEGETEERKPLKWLPLFASLVVLFAVVYMWRSFSEMSNGGQFDVELSDNIPKDRLNQTPSLTESRVIPTDSNAGLDSGSKHNTEEALVEDIQIDNERENLSDENGSSTEVPTTHDLSEEDNRTEISNSTELESTEDQKLSIYGVKPKVQDNDKCVIIVGAFGRQSNVQKMNDDLRSKGFEIYIDSSNNLTRVGFYADCLSSELKDKLDLARSEIERGSWILDR
jgi:cell division septation protein DedD